MYGYILYTFETNKKIYVQISTQTERENKQCDNNDKLCTLFLVKVIRVRRHNEQARKILSDANSVLFYLHAWLERVAAATPLCVYGQARPTSSHHGSGTAVAIVGVSALLFLRQLFPSYTTCFLDLVSLYTYNKLS